MKPYLKHVLFSLALVTPVAVMVACGPSEIRKVSPKEDPNVLPETPPAETFQRKAVNANGTFSIETVLRLENSKETIKGTVQGVCLKSMDEEAFEELNGIAILSESRILLLKTKKVDELTEEEKAGRSAEDHASVVVNNPVPPPEPAATPVTTATATEPKPEATPVPTPVEVPKAEAEPEVKDEALAEVVDMSATSILNCNSGGKPIINKDGFKKTEFVSLEIDKTVTDVVFADALKQNDASKRADVENHEVEAESYQITIACRDNLDAEAAASALNHKNEITIFRGSTLVLRRDLEHKLADDKNLQGKNAFVVYTCQ